jgi:hypothetical protein
MYSTNYSCKILMKVNFFQTFWKNPYLTNLMKIRPVLAELFHADRQTDMTNLTVASRSFAKPSTRYNIGFQHFVFVNIVNPASHSEVYEFLNSVRDKCCSIQSRVFSCAASRALLTTLDLPARVNTGRHYIFSQYSVWITSQHLTFTLEPHLKTSTNLTDSSQAHMVRRSNPGGVRGFP